MVAELWRGSDLGRRARPRVWACRRRHRYCVISRTEGPTSGDYKAVEVGTLEFAFCVGRTHPLARSKKTLSNEDLLKHTAIVVADSARVLPARTTGLGCSTNAVRISIAWPPKAGSFHEVASIHRHSQCAREVGLRSSAPTASSGAFSDHLRQPGRRDMLHSGREWPWIVLPRWRPSYESYKLARSRLLAVSCTSGNRPYPRRLPS